MGTALQHRHRGVPEPAEPQPAGMAGDSRPREAGDLAIGDVDGIGHRVGDRAEAGAEHDPDRRGGSRGGGPDGAGGHVDGMQFGHHRSFT